MIKLNECEVACPRQSRGQGFFHESPNLRHSTKLCHRKSYHIRSTTSPFVALIILILKTLKVFKKSVIYRRGLQYEFSFFFFLLDYMHAVHCKVSFISQQSSKMPHYQAV